MFLNKLIIVIIIHCALQGALEYERYLKEVVNALETDPEFRKKLDNATDVDIRVSFAIICDKYK